MRKVVALLIILCWVQPAVAAPQKTAAKKSASTAKKPTTTAKKAPAKKTAAKKAPAKKTTAKKTTPKKKTTTARKKTTTRKRPVRKTASWRTGQMRPAPERYSEIQQALIDKGYLQGPATGVWGDDSIAALKKFQQDQNLEPSGELNSLSLITLGLGPKRETPAPTIGAPGK